MPFDNLIKLLLEKAGNNIDKSGNMLSKQVALAGKQVEHPEYQASPEELENQNRYFQSLANSIASSVAPIKDIKSTITPSDPIGKKLSPKQMLDFAYEQAESAAKEGRPSPYTMKDIKKLIKKVP